MNLWLKNFRLLNVLVWIWMVMILMKLLWDIVCNFFVLVLMYIFFCVSLLFSWYCWFCRVMWNDVIFMVMLCNVDCKGLMVEWCVIFWLLNFGWYFCVIVVIVGFIKIWLYLRLLMLFCVIIRVKVSCNFNGVWICVILGCMFGVVWLCNIRNLIWFLLVVCWVRKVCFIMLNMLG